MSKLFVASLAALFLITPALAHDYKVGSLHIGHPWSRATPKGAPGGGFLAITNNGPAADRLIGGSSPIAKEFELHQTSEENGVAKMRLLEGGLEIKPGETVTLRPGGYHIMFVGIDKPLKQGDRVPATLDFAKAGKVQVEFAIEGLGATHGEAGGEMPGMSGHDMSGMAGRHGH